MTDVGISVGIVPETAGARVIKRSLDDLNQAGKSVERQMGATASATAKLGDAFKGLFAAYGFREIARITDQYTLMNARLKNIVGSVGEANRAMGELRRISNETGTSIDSSITILQRLSFVRKEINATNNDMLAFTETVAKLGVQSGASTEAMKAGLMQLGQALSSQYTRAEEFNSIMENIPGVGKAIADQLGVTTGQLRLLVVQGKLLSSDVFAAILNQTEAVRQKMAEMPRTIAMAGNEAKTSFEILTAKIMGTTNGTEAFVKVIDFGNDRLKEMTAAVDVIRMSFDFMGDRVKVTFNNIAYEIQQIYNKASTAIYDLTSGKVNLGIKSDVYKLDYSQSLDQFNAAKSNAVRAAMGETYGPQAPTTQRQISQDYAKIAAGLGSDKEALREQKRLQKEITSAINGSRTEQEKLTDEIAKLERLKGLAKSKEQIDLLNRGIQNTQAELDKLKLKTELDSPLAKGFEAVANEIQDGFKDAFKGAFEGGGSMFKKFADGVKATFKSLMLDIVYQAAVRPIVVSVLGGVGGSMGLSSNAVASVLGTSGGSRPSLSGLSSLSGLINGGLYSNTLGGIGSGIGNVLSGQAWGAMGPSRAAAIGGSAFGNLGYGAIGGLGASLLGIGSKNMVVNGVASTAGSLIGGAFGPIGALAGGFLGSALGGLFGGGKPSDSLQNNRINFDTMTRDKKGSMTGDKYSSANAKYAASVIDQAVALQQLFASDGGETSGQIRAMVGSRDGLRLRASSFSGTKNYGNNDTKFLSAVLNAVINQTTGISDIFKQVIGKVGTKDPTKLMSSVSFAESYQNTLDPNRRTQLALADSIEAINKQFADLLKTATELGLPLEEYTKALDKQKVAAIGAAKAQAAGFASFEQMTATFDSFFNNQALGANSSLNPLEKLQVAQNNFGSLLTKAQGGDLSVTPDLLNSANTLLDLGRGVYASGTSFTGLESFVKSSVQGVAQQSGYSGQNVSYSIVSTNQLVATNIQEMNNKITELSAEIFRLSNKLAAA